MKSNSEDVSLLDLYIKNQLNEEESQNVEARLATEEALKKDYEFLLKVSADARALCLAEVWEEVKGFEKEYKTEMPKVKTKKPIRWMYWRIAWILLLCFVATYFLFFKDNKKQPPSMYADVFGDRFEEEFILHTTYRSSTKDTVLSKDQQQAYNLYSIKAFDEARPLLEQLWKTQADTLALYYWGISELGLGNVDKSKDILLEPALKKYDISFINK